MSPLARNLVAASPYQSHSYRFVENLESTWNTMENRLILLVRVLKSQNLCHWTFSILHINRSLQYLEQFNRSIMPLNHECYHISSISTETVTANVLFYASMQKVSGATPVHDSPSRALGLFVNFPVSGVSNQTPEFIYHQNISIFYFLENEKWISTDFPSCDVVKWN